MAEKPLIPLAPDSVPDPYRAPRRTGEAAAASGQALERAGQTLMVAADRVMEAQVRAAERQQRLAEDAEVAGLHARISAGQAAWAKDIGERVRTAPLGDRELVPRFQKDFDTYSKSLMDSAKTPGGRNYLTKALAEQRAHFTEHADQAQVAVSAAYAKSTYDASIQEFSSALVTDPTGLPVAVTTHRERVASMVSAGILNQKDAPALLVQGETTLARSAALGTIRLDPEGGKAELLAGAYDQWLDGPQKAALVKQADEEIRAREADRRSAIAAAEAEANRRRAATFDRTVDALLGDDPSAAPSQTDIVRLDLHGRDTMALVELREKQNERNIVSMFGEAVRPVLEKIKGSIPGMDELLSPKFASLRGDELLRLAGKLEDIAAIPQRIADRAYAAKERERREAEAALEATSEAADRRLLKLGADVNLNDVRNEMESLTNKRLEHWLDKVATAEEKAAVLRDREEGKAREEAKAAASGRRDKALKLLALLGPRKTVRDVMRVGADLTGEDMDRQLEGLVSREEKAERLKEHKEDRARAEERYRKELAREKKSEAKEAFEAEEQRVLKGLELLGARKTAADVILVSPSLTAESFRQQLGDTVSQAEKDRLLKEHEEDRTRLAEDRRKASDKYALEQWQNRNAEKVSERVAAGTMTVDLLRMVRGQISKTDYLKFMDQVGGDREKAEARAEREAEKKREEEAKAKVRMSRAEMVGRIFLPPTDPARVNTVTDIRRLEAAGSFDKLDKDDPDRFADLIRERDKDAASSMEAATKALAARTLGRLYMRVHGLGGEPRITDDRELIPHFVPGGLDEQGLKFLRQELRGAGTSAGAMEEDMLRSFARLARSKIAPMNSDLLGIRDPKAEDALYSFTADFAQRYREARSKGATPEELLSPKSPKFLGAGLEDHKRPMIDVMNDVMESISGTSLPPRAPVPKKSTKSFDVDELFRK